MKQKHYSKIREGLEDYDPSWEWYDSEYDNCACDCCRRVCGCCNDSILNMKADWVAITTPDGQIHYSHVDHLSNEDLICLGITSEKIGSALTNSDPVIRKIAIKFWRKQRSK